MTPCIRLFNLKAQFLNEWRISEYFIEIKDISYFSEMIIKWNKTNKPRKTKRKREMGTKSAWFSGDKQRKWTSWARGWTWHKTGGSDEGIRFRSSRLMKEAFEVRWGHIQSRSENLATSAAPIILSMALKERNQDQVGRCFKSHSGKSVIAK